MKKETPLVFASFIASVLFLTACQKDNNLPVLKSKTELLTQNAWKFNTASVGGTDASGYLQACQKDNVYIFGAAGTGTINEGVSKCDPNDPQNGSFDWSFVNSESMLNISTILFYGGSNDFSLVSLNEAQLVISQTYPPYGIITVTFVH